MKKLAYSILVVIGTLVMSGISYAQSNKKIKSKLDSSSVKVEVTCSVDKDGTVRTQNGEIIGKMTKDGLLLDNNNATIGRREKTSAELIRDAYLVL